MVLATLIAAMGILTDSQILIIGAMVVGPEFGPLAGICVAVVERRLRLARRSLAALAVGFPLAIGSALTATLLLRGVDRAPEALSAGSHPATLFISRPNVGDGLRGLERARRRSRPARTQPVRARCRRGRNPRTTAPGVRVPASG
jgi:hypothetical protein